MINVKRDGNTLGRVCRMPAAPALADAAQKQGDREANE
jgi:hypothetical protein